ncbi:MAG: nicotinate-nucleotide--dimethylbenzimidazole phosphoribosyltransferase [Rhodobacteraceae bacterium]|nr:nicotinate-nucleotide--dimethylbenzimidazole phosphoribosyltransferase [Paracoccaceae bacterium]MCY4250598.1 nicotinate-nucleotide--dimethylbenzimidazole phosphoribosyltransferase [Paracoccaceae bacterium]
MNKIKSNQQNDRDPFELVQESLQDLPRPNSDHIDEATTRNRELTKPLGSLGRLEDLAIWYAGWQGAGKRDIDSILITIFAGNHGVARSGVSAFPIEVTHQMVGNFQQGGAAINQLASLLPSTLKVVPIDLDVPTRDFTKEEAMSRDEFSEAFRLGFEAIDERHDLVIPGEMGIGNTTSAAAIATALFGGDAKDWTGKGTGIDDHQLRLKIDVINRGLQRHGEVLDSPLEVLRCLGGRELAALAGAIFSARLKSIPVILDGYICTSVAAVLFEIDQELLAHVVAGHRSAEKAHARLLKKMNLMPMLDLDMRLGEASGAGVAAHILRAAVKCHGGMATFAEAMVANKS